MNKNNVLQMFINVSNSFFIPSQFNMSKSLEEIERDAEKGKQKYSIYTYVSYACYVHYVVVCCVDVAILFYPT